MNCHSSNAHIGDLIWCLSAMSRLGGSHILCCNPDYVPQLRELVAGLSIEVRDCSDIPPNSMDCWIASGLFEGQGIRYQDNIDIMGFVQRYFNTMAGESGKGVPFPTRRHMLGSFPAILEKQAETPAFNGILVINCDPKSGQCPRYSSSEMDALILKLEDAGHSVCSVQNADLSLVQIGALSIFAKLIIGCATGPWWATMTGFNATIPRICMLDPMRLDYGPQTPIHHAADAAEVEDILREMKYL